MGLIDKLRGGKINNRMGHSFMDPKPGSGFLSNKVGTTHTFGKHIFTASGASLRMQALWRSLPEWKKNQLRRTLKDSDGDGVPDKFDCQPLNPKKQDYVPSSGNATYMPAPPASERSGIAGAAMMAQSGYTRRSNEATGERYWQPNQQAQFEHDRAVEKHTLENYANGKKKFLGIF